MKVEALVVGAGGVVQVVLGVAGTAVHRLDRAGARVHRDRAGLDVGVDGPLLLVELAGELVLDGLLQGLLLLLADVQLDVPAAAADHGLGRLEVVGGAGGDQFAGQFGVGRVDQVAGLALLARVGLGVLGHRELHAVAVGLVQPLLLDHVVQDVVPAVLHQLLAGVGGDGPVVLAGGLEQCGEVGALLDGQLVGVDAVVRLGGGLDAVGVAAVVAGVDVPGQDVVLGLLAVQLERDDQFLQLARDGLFLGQVVVLDVLLGDRRAALRALAHEGVEDARVVPLRSTPASS